MISAAVPGKRADGLDVALVGWLKGPDAASAIPTLVEPSLWRPHGGIELFAQARCRWMWHAFVSLLHVFRQRCCSLPDCQHARRRDWQASGVWRTTVEKSTTLAHVAVRLSPAFKRQS